MNSYLLFQEIPYTIDHRLMGWKELRDGSLRIEQHLITHKQSQRKIIVGKKGSKIGYDIGFPVDAFLHVSHEMLTTTIVLCRKIGIEANEELRSIFKRDVHLILQVRVA